MATKNSINNKSESLAMDPGASEDSFVQFDINTIGEFRIGVYDPDGSFRVSQGSALGTSDTFIMTADGERTMPLQSAFSAYLGTTDTNSTGDGTRYTVGTINALTEIFDQNSDFNTNGTFTAPITGLYMLSGSILFGDLTSSYTDSNLRFNASNNIYHGSYINSGNLVDSSGNLSINKTVLADMDAGDTSTMEIQTSGSTKVVDAVSSNADTIYSGALMY